MHSRTKIFVRFNVKVERVKLPTNPFAKLNGRKIVDAMFKAVNVNNRLIRFS